MHLLGRKVAVLVEDYYEDLELWYPVLRMREAGAEVRIVGPEAGRQHMSKHGYPVKADASASDVDASSLDALIIPGGYAPDHMRQHPEMVKLVADVHERGAVVAFVCHGGWMPASAGIVRGRRVTSWPSIRDDMRNAGGEWVDQACVRDGNLISSRQPADLPDFCRVIIEALNEAGAVRAAA